MLLNLANFRTNFSQILNVFLHKWKINYMKRESSWKIYHNFTSKNLVCILQIQQVESLPSSVAGWSSDIHVESSMNKQTNIFFMYIHEYTEHCNTYSLIG